MSFATTAFPVNLALLLALPVAFAMAPLSLRSAVVRVGAAAEPPLTMGEEDSLLQEDADRSHEVHSNRRVPNPADLFGAFDQGESTWDYDGKFGGDANPARSVADGWDPEHEDLSSSGVRDSMWFRESHSGGDIDAFQAHPPLTKSFAGNEVKTGKWFTGRGGKLQQEYLEGATLSHQGKDIPASWFDSFVKQLDGYGRGQFPAVGSPLNYLEWKERSVNTSFSCKSPGCIANVSLFAPFDATKELYKNCRMSVFFHPTDFDDQYSGERVEWVQVNDKLVSSNCHPVAQGCNQTAQRPLLPCVRDLPIDHLMPKNGDLKIAAKIPKVVDECPYHGNLLSGVPMVTCLVTPKPNKQQPPKPVKVSLQAHPDGACVVKMPLRCATRGCASEIAIPVQHACTTLGKCMLSINVSQTDFDNSDGTSELIEYIKVGGKTVASKVNPGKNPCKSAWNGTATNTSGYSFVALKDHVVNASSGSVLVEGKISQYVDECASNGYLFDAIAEVTCTPKRANAKPTLFQQKALRGYQP